MRGRNALIGGARGTLLVAACWEFLEDELETSRVLGRNNPRNPCLTRSLNRRFISWEVRDKYLQPRFCRAQTPYHDQWQSPRWQENYTRTFSSTVLRTRMRTGRQWVIEGCWVSVLFWVNKPNRIHPVTCTTTTLFEHFLASYNQNTTFITSSSPEAQDTLFDKILVGDHHLPSNLSRAALRLQFPPSYVFVGVYRLCTDKNLY